MKGKINSANPIVGYCIVKLKTKKFETNFQVFTRKEHLNNHLKHHSPDNPHVCTICSKPFTRKENLVNHMRFGMVLKELKDNLIINFFRFSVAVILVTGHSAVMFAANHSHWKAICSFTSVATIRVSKLKEHSNAIYVRKTSFRKVIFIPFIWNCNLKSVISI